MYPPKPIIEKSQNKITNLLFSVLLFFGAGYLFFDGDLVFILILILVLGIHEFGHFIVMKYFGYENLKMMFIPLLGAVVTSDKPSPSQRARTLVLIAGPFPGIIIGLILYVLGTYYNLDRLIPASIVFIGLNLFNLIPLMPLDGGQLTQTLFFRSNDKIQKTFSILSIIGLSMIAMFMEDYILLIIPALVAFNLKNTLQLQKFKEGIAKDGIDCNKDFDQLTDKEYWKIRMTAIASYRNLQNLDPGNYGDSKQEKIVNNIIKSIMNPSPENDIKNTERVIYTCLWLVFLIVPLIILI